MWISHAEVAFQNFSNGCVGDAADRPEILKVVGPFEHGHTSLDVIEVELEWCLRDVALILARDSGRVCEEVAVLF